MSESFARSRIGHFEVRAELGHGGMGVVYEAVDEKLGRTVALKVLPEALASDPMRRDRFLREARAAAQISHGAIATVFEIGESEGRLYIAMERVEGRTLRDHLANGPLPLDRALDVARQIASALARAHQAGIAHRDLKPENVMLSDDGQVKILDFGIAKALGGGDEATGGAWTTREGFVLGTPGYMAPEQAAGKKSDQHADVFSFGVLLFEMLTGRAPFVGETPMERVASVLRDEPLPLGENAEGAPEDVRALLAACLRKDPAERPADGAALLTALRGTVSAPRAVVHAERLSVDPLAKTLATPPDVAAAYGFGANATKPAAATTTASSVSAAATPPRRRRLVVWLVAGVVSTLALATVVVVQRVRRNHRMHESVTNASTFESRRSVGAPTPPGALPPVWPCAGVEGATVSARCSRLAVAWCDAAGRELACCGKGLVPSDANGACGCPPGGAFDTPAAASCPKAQPRPKLERIGVQRVVRGHLAELRECFRRTQGPTATPRGRVVFDTRISHDGRVFSARIRESSIPSSDAQACFLDVWRRLRFEPFPGGEGVDISYPLSFEQE